MTNKFNTPWPSVVHYLNPETQICRDCKADPKRPGKDSWVEYWYHYDGKDEISLEEMIDRFRMVWCHEAIAWEITNE